MGLITWIVFGLIVGVLAKWIKPNLIKGGIIVTILLGIAGAVLGGWIGGILGFGGYAGFNLVNLGISLIGALIIIWLYGLLVK